MAKPLELCLRLSYVQVNRTERLPSSSVSSPPHHPTTKVPCSTSGPFPDYDPSHEDCTHQNVSPPETRRVVIGARSTCVLGYPSCGGVLVLPLCNGVDLSFLGLPRFDSSERSEDSAAEDRHCARMRKLGAWEFESVREYDMLKFFTPRDLVRKTLVVAAWPQGGEGVWVLAMCGDEAAGKGVGRVWNALSMDERCEVVEKLGGKFYQHSADCPDLKL
ncbi:hypothetical protein F4781DRAFT_434387 [Annulohypoxylon bovei var. microspora]|nr:hypothetical protein F4781DRAFT_434387 [Annulohypoxylon bovei var. microspora]